MGFKNIHTRFFRVLTFAFLSCILSSVSYAQQDPMYTHYMFNKMVYNPAYAGTNREYIDITLLYHTQWLGFQKNSQSNQGAGNSDYIGKPPQTETFSIHAPLPNTPLGAGLYIINDLEGFNSLISINLALSFKKDFSFGTMQFGLNGGYIQGAINGKWLPPDINWDPFIPPAANAFAPDLGAGVYLFSSRYYVGLSAQHLLASKFDWTAQEQGIYSQARVFFVTAGYNFLLPNNPDYQIEPSTLIKIDPGRWQYELNAKALYRERFWGGLSWKQGDTWSAMLGMKLTPALKFGYSYDYSASEMRKVNSGTHEIMVDYIFKITVTKKVYPKIIIWTPRFL